MAIESPPSVMVFRLRPILFSAITAARSDRGIAVQEMAAVRRLKRNKKRTTTTRMPPITNDSRTLCSAMPMKRSEEHTSELQSHVNLVCRLLLEKKKKKK